jgi:hypothetical protein
METVFILFSCLKVDLNVVEFTVQYSYFTSLVFSLTLEILRHVQLKKIITVLLFGLFLLNKTLHNLGDN